MHKLISEDTAIYRQDLLVMYLYDCAKDHKDIAIDFHLEGPCCRTNNLYTILDEFCRRTDYDPKRIKIYTANQIEKHDLYTVIRRPEYWYEVNLIRAWMTQNAINFTAPPTKHFGIFVGRATWSRAWVSAVLYRHKQKAIQTFHSGYNQNYVVPLADSIVDPIGLDLLNQYGCNIIPEVAAFLDQCPIVNQHNVELIKQTRMFIKPSNNNCYPIQHPANLNILSWYQDFVVDIVCETRVLGDTFFVSEKTWRCIVARRPFIVVGAGNFLKNLKKLGFQTFNNFWDEGYDDYGPTQRMQQIEQLIQTLADKSVQEMQDLLASMESVLEHNFNIFKQLTHQQIKETFND